MVCDHCKGHGFLTLLVGGTEQCLFCEGEGIVELIEKKKSEEE